MWKKPSVEKPDFNKFELNEMSESEVLQITGGGTAIGYPVKIRPDYPLEIRPFPPPLSGMVALPFEIIPIGELKPIEVIKTIKL